MRIFPKELIDAIVSNEAVVVIGSGLSTAAGFPSWSKLIESMVAECEKNVVGFNDGNELRSLLERGFLNEVADECRQRLGGSLYRDFIQNIFQISVKPTENHQILCNIPFSAVLTTNYDTLIESAYVEYANKNLPPVYTQKNVSQLAKLASEKRFFIFKMHGHVDEIDSIILTSSDYQKLIHGHPAYRIALSAIFSTRTLLFLGYGLRDADLNLIFSEHSAMFGGFGRRHYALVANPGTILSKIFLAQYNIAVIPYNSQKDHLELKELLLVLYKEVAANMPTISLKQCHINEITRCPYKFLDYYDGQDKELFFGRERETVAVLQSLFAHKLLLLFGQSGIGKTSLIKASLIPELIDRSYTVIYHRLTSSISELVLTEFGRVLNVKLDYQKGKQAAVTFLESMKKVAKKPVIIFDKFEQLFIDYSKEVFSTISELIGSLIDSDIWHCHILISIREDYFVKLNEMTSAIPAIFNNRYQLSALTSSSAERAIREPAKYIGLECEDQYVESVLRDLDRDGIEPPQLQIVCTSVFNALSKDSKKIDLTTYNHLGGAEKILSGYVAYVLNILTADDRDVAREILKCFVSPNRSRAMATFQGLCSQLIRIYNDAQIENVLSILISNRLIRAIQGQLETEYELVHDYLIPQIDQWISDEERETRRIKEVIDHERTICTYLKSIIPLQRARFLKGYIDQVDFSASDRELIDNSIEQGEIREKQIEDLQQQLLQSQKMEALGAFAGGIAHDFRNILTSAAGHLSILEMDLRDRKLINESSKVRISSTLEALEKGSQLVQAILSFSQKRVSDFKPLNLNKVLKSTTQLLSRLIGEDVNLRTYLSQDDVSIFGDVSQIEQAILNLAVNSRDAMPNGGDLIIKTQIVTKDDEFQTVHGKGRPGSYVLISFSDTGTGMDKSTILKIFEPFFTTKEKGKGTGLGLSMVYGIVKAHDGYINIESKVNVGSTFSIYFPLTKKYLEESNEIISEDFEVRGSETLLLVEDDKLVRSATKDLLEHHGYNIITAVDGVDAVNKFTENQSKIKLAILDIITPKLNGKEVYDRIIDLKPNLKVVFTSGYAEDNIAVKEIIEKGLSCFTKSTKPKHFLRIVRKLLDS